MTHRLRNHCSKVIISASFTGQAKSMSISFSLPLILPGETGCSKGQEDLSSEDSKTLSLTWHFSMLNCHTFKTAAR